MKVKHYSFVPKPKRKIAAYLMLFRNFVLFAGCLALAYFLGYFGISLILTYLFIPFVMGIVDVYGIAKFLKGEAKDGLGIGRLLSKIYAAFFVILSLLCSYNRAILPAIGFLFPAIYHCVIIYFAEYKYNTETNQNIAEPVLADEQRTEKSEN